MLRRTGAISYLKTLFLERASRMFPVPTEQIMGGDLSWAYFYNLCGQCKHPFMVSE